VLGSFRRSQERDILRFEMQPAHHLQHIQPDELPLKDLFMLAAGCLPLSSTPKYFRIARGHEIEDATSIASSDSDREQHSRPKHCYDEPYSTLVEGLISEEPLTRSCKAYELFQTSDLHQGLNKIPETFGAECVEVWQSRKVVLTSGLMAALTRYAKMTYSPTETLWVR